MITKRKIIYFLLLIGIILAVVGFVVLYDIVRFQTTKISFLDVGQGDAILISHGTNQILIDGGSSPKVLMEELGKQMPFWDRTIEIVVATHPDSDHINGLVSVFDYYNINQFWHTNASKDTSIYKTLINRAHNEKGVEDMLVFNGLRAILDEGIFLDVIYPFDDNMSEISEINDTSIVTLLSVGDKKFYFGGDLTSEIEDNLPINEKITVLKAGHHGSANSTSEKFLDKVKPTSVIISVGKDNHYGHPHEKVVKRIENNGAIIYRTDINGTVTYNCDKNFNCKVIIERD